MKKNEALLRVRIQLPEDFSEELKRVAHQELLVARRKWKVVITPEEEAHILEASFAQLENKVTAVTKTRWTTSMDHLTVIVGCLQERHVVLPLEEGAEVPTDYLIRKNEDWHLDDEPTWSSVRLADLDTEMIESMKTWLRTAVFYGVGSYA